MTDPACLLKAQADLEGQSESIYSSLQSSMQAEDHIGSKPCCSEPDVDIVHRYTEFKNASTSIVDTTNMSRIDKGMLLTQIPVGRNGMRGCRSTNG